MPTVYIFLELVANVLNEYIEIPLTSAINNETSINDEINFVLTLMFFNSFKIHPQNQLLFRIFHYFNVNAVAI